MCSFLETMGIEYPKILFIITFFQIFGAYAMGFDQVEPQKHGNLWFNDVE